MRRRGSSGEGAGRHTAVVVDVPSMWEKLVWDVDKFEEIQRDHPDLPEPLGFAAINVCISASSLRHWAVGAFRRRRRAEGEPVSERDVLDHIYAHVPSQRMCEAIANTAKHASFDAGGWPGGSVRPESREPDEDDPGGYVLQHVHEDGAYESIALNAFGALTRSWWGELQNLGFAFPGGVATIEWKQRKLRTMFGRRS